LGAVYAQALAAEGASVIVVDIDPRGADATAEQIRRTGGVADSHHADLTKEDDVDRLVSSTVTTFGRIDILVNNAGGALPDSVSSLEDITVDHWRRTLEMNLTSAFLCCRAVAPHMKRQRYGKIVNVSSRSARSTGWFSQVSPAYVCAKSGVLALTRHVAKELGPYGINVNCLVPGFTISGPKLQQAWDRMTDEERETMIKLTPLRRLPSPHELANVVVFLCSDASSYITGAAIDVNGGSFMG
jgi:NAD(P)-dependent dehydrogenase (short-subunit alcohol dehydrogenase family)